MSNYEAPHYMEPYYKSRIAELEMQLKQARAELARLALNTEQPDETKDSWVDSPDFDPL